MPLTLDRKTLFYWNLHQSPAKKLKHSIESWAKSIPANAMPASRATRRRANSVSSDSSSASRTSASESVIPSPINASSRSTGVHILTGIHWHEGGLSDHDETNGCEYEAACAAPFKGRKRLNSEALVRITKPKTGEPFKKPKTEEPSKKPKTVEPDPNSIFTGIRWHEGGLSDYDEINGCEAAWASQFKGRKRPNSEALVRITKPKTGESSKKPKNIEPDPNSTFTGIRWHEGLSDHDETNGCEREAAWASQFKGRRRLNSEALVVITKPKTGAPYKKHRVGDLPNGIDFTVWSQVFVPTFMKWVSQQDTPFKLNPNLTCKVMQKIWDALFDEVPHMVVRSSPVYALVSNNFKIMETSSYSVSQTVQRVSDSWRRTIGSTAIAIVLAFCNSNPDLKDSDEERQEFATYYLEHLRFVYENSDGDDPKKFTGAFLGPFILQTFAAHLTAIKGARNLSSLNDPGNAPCGGLALCAAAVERALKFIAAGMITVEMVQKAKGKVPTLPKQLNPATGKASNRSTAFNEVTCGLRCRFYVKAAKKQTTSRFEKIIALAKKYMTTPYTESFEDDPRANLVDNSSGSEPESD
ncbi:hypothetical protein BJV78DRAFT_850438 [Lactifluus subvellereus]|nr:hypothetical protein BJV78DRAFT_850438 [Lactifluus subvellereus]